MRSLVRLLLFTIARVALSLTVVLWLISDIWGITGTGRTMGVSFRIVNCREGIAVSGAQTLSEDWTFEYLTPEELDEASWVFAPSARDQQTFQVSDSVRGVTFVEGMGRVLVSVRHWLLVGSAIGFYVVLLLIYRKRKSKPVVSPDGSESKIDVT